MRISTGVERAGCAGFCGDIGQYVALGGKVWNKRLIRWNARRMTTLELKRSFGDFWIFAYGKLRSENGVHRLVRLSPFNADVCARLVCACRVLLKLTRPMKYQLLSGLG